jgi:hypothetical protein
MQLKHLLTVLLNLRIKEIYPRRVSSITQQRIERNSKLENLHCLHMIRMIEIKKPCPISLRENQENCSFLPL